MRARVYIKLLVGIFLLWVVIGSVNWHETLAVLSKISPGYIGGLLLISFFLVFISCVKWQILLHARGTKVRLDLLIKLYLIGYFFNNFAPGSLGGDVMRSFKLGQSTGNQAEAFGTVFLERFTGFLALMCMAVISSLLRPALFEYHLLAGFIWAMLFFSALCILLYFNGRWQQLWVFTTSRYAGHKAVRMTQRFVDVIFFFRDRPEILLRVMILSAGFHLMTVINTHVTAASIGLQLDLPTLAVIVPVVLLVAMIPVSLNALGIMEGGFVFFLGMVGVDAPSALAIALILRAKNIVLALVGAGFFVAWKHRSPAPAT